jgi:O-antigen/teichoic acid export membrane protein
MFQVSETLVRLVMRIIPVALGMAFLFLGQAFLARLMGPDSFGTYSYYLTWVTVAALLAKAGHEWIILKSVPGKVRSDRPGEIRFLVFRSFKAVGIRAALGACILTLAAFLLGQEEGLTVNVMIAGSFLILCLAMAEMRRALALAYGAVWLAETPENIAKSVLLVAVAATLALTGSLSAGAMLWSNLLVTAISSAAAMMIFMYGRGSSVRTSSSVPIETKDLDDLMRSMWLTNFLNIVLRYGDILLIGALTDFTTTGVYIAATRVAALAAAPIMILDRIIAPQIAEAAEFKDRNKLQSSSWEYSLLSTASCVGLLILLAIWGNDFISILFGDAYQGALIVVWIMLIGHAANALTGPTGVLLSMTGLHRTTVVIASTCAVFYVILLYLLTPEYLAIGAATAFALAHSAKAFMQLFFVYRYLSFNPTVLRLPRIRTTLVNKG